jgi:hypothetical protein
VTSHEPANHTANGASTAGTQVAGYALAPGLAPLVQASINAAVAPMRAELADVRAMLSQRDQELGAALGRIRTRATDALENASQRDSEGLTREVAEPAPNGHAHSRPWWRLW